MACNLTLVRYSTSKLDTTGLLFLNGNFVCYTLEDTHREKKIPGATRIPAGTYQIALREIGTVHARYKQRYPSFHKGMIWIKDVPNYDGVLIHIGNTYEDTRGCILVGDSVGNNAIEDGKINFSAQAYRRLYKQVLETIDENSYITIKDSV
jgi:hypothetical protein